VHLAEERNQVGQKDVDETNRYASNNHDEEMLYSGVYRDKDLKSTGSGKINQ